MITREKQLKQVTALIEKCMDEKYWGKVVLSFKGGKVVLLGREETIKLEDYEEVQETKDKEAS